MILGIDTSYYTTSMALVSDGGKLLREQREMIPVEQGKCGVAQSQAVFSHIHQAPRVLQQVLSRRGAAKITGVCASVRPRPAEDSYMPVFCVGESAGKMLAQALGVPFFATTHQEGHLAAARWSLPAPPPTLFLAVHISGGTSELLHVKEGKGRFEIKILGRSDLAAGQFVDRVGVALGLGFPAGPELERLAESVEQPEVKLQVAVNGLDFSFSGPESAAARLIKWGADAKNVAAAVFDNIAATLSKVIKAAALRTGTRYVLITGGVAANSRLRRYLTQHLSPGLSVCFSHPRYAGDNAVGVALLGLEMLNAEKGAR
ncbi:MAG: O-sialoglycoprotein endopeptidase [Clostridiales bacterium]|nr:O-sialoglycoprotein endopeptidase [Clostridiales bacterium]